MSWLLDALNDLVTGPLSRIIELPLDPRWESYHDDDDESFSESRNAINRRSEDWYFRHHKDVATDFFDQEERDLYGQEQDQQQAGGVERQSINTPSISVSDLVSHIQSVHCAVFQLDTTSTAAIASSSSSSSSTTTIAGKARRRHVGGGGSSMLLQNRNKSRRIKQLRHEIEMNRKRHEYNKKLLDYVLYMLDNRHVMQPDVFITHNTTGGGQDSGSGGDHEDDFETSKPVPTYHLIRDFDQIQQLYDECVLDALNVEHSMKLLNRRRQADIDMENETLSRLVHSYLHGPVQKDEYYRRINNSIFHDFDDDPFQLLVSEQGLAEHKLDPTGDDMPSLDETVLVNHIYPKLGVLSKKSAKDRLKRRTLLLSTANNSDNTNEWDIEVERISALLSVLVDD